MRVEVEYSSTWLSMVSKKPIPVSVDESTIGVDIIQSLQLSSSDNIVYTAWDFAGQLQYISLHPVSKNISSYKIKSQRYRLIPHL